jgi:hypothetical protein
MVARKKKYEVAVYNRMVRETLYQGERNRTGYSDDWAQTHFVEVSATSDDDARRMLLRRYPAEKGFVVEGVICLEPD